ncbi:PREDICTED: uncharacterized protein LOC108568662 [Nicrophorus vespilloides]|uniref:Uncharacterized protein LOC108568662 n=1 Tax=Nicrophorus vespilloides TaxID=110193 RepID=A0ABM1NEW0_NICVS|nr:PREDICTED: uncharacterized protein LOC108568662 [Nicrophorus vespilloides]
MGTQKKITNAFDIANTFDEQTGIQETFKTKYSFTELDKASEEHVCELKDDPVLPHNRDANKRLKIKVVEPPMKVELIEPSVSTRLQYGLPYLGAPGTKYYPPHLPGFRKMKVERERKLLEDKNFCHYGVVKVPSPTILSSITEKVEFTSPEVSRAKVVPERPSFVSPSATYPPPQTDSILAAHKPKSGVFINEEKEGSDDEDGEVKKKKKKKLAEQEQQLIQEQIMIEEEMNWFQSHGEGYVPSILMENKSTHMSDNVILGKYGEIISNASSATSVNDKDLLHFDDVSWCDLPVTSRLVQTIRDAHLEKAAKKFKKGSLENHSFTKIKQRTVDDFSYKATIGTLHQADISFLKISRDNQGICMPVAAFCYSQLFRPKLWNSRNVDEVVELGNNLFLESIGELHMGKDKKRISVEEIQKYMIIRDKKIKYEILDPEIKGLVRSMDKKIYNLTRGLTIFFLKFDACILRTEHSDCLIWRRRKSFYFFDGKARKANLYEDPNGKAVLANIPKLKGLISMLLNRTKLENCRFNICQIRLLKVCDKDEKEIVPYQKDLHTYVIINERKAVVQGTYELGDYCFGFTRNKQALAMSTVALVYSRLTPPSNWHKKTVDKILLIGDQLHNLCMEVECCCDLCLDHLPAVFTVGPYIIEVHIYTNRFADFMFKKGTCMFQEHLTSFFEKNSHAIVQIGKCYIAIWKQRDMFYLFDPYNRNKEGLKCRVGTAIVSMNKDLETLVETVLMNFENHEAVFYLHALKVLKINRDPDYNRIFPKTVPMHEIPLECFKKHKVRKSKKKAIEKPIHADCNQHALKKLLAGAPVHSSIIEIGSNIGSLNSYVLQPLEAKLKFLPKIQPRKSEDEIVVDLDSPSLSDTQIVPRKPSPDDEEEIDIDDLDAYALTEEEKELQDTGEGEGDIGRYIVRGLGEGEGEGGSDDGSRYAVMSQVTSGELDPCYTTHFINTDLTYCYKILPALELPIKTAEDREIVIDEDDQKEEYEKRRNYVQMGDDLQILHGKTNAINVAGSININLLVPYCCIMASAYALEVPLHRWDSKTVDFVLQAGKELYGQYKTSFIRIEDFKFELKKNTLFATVDLIFNTYIGDGLFDIFSGLKVLEQFLEMHVFNKEDCGFVIMPYYACAVFFKKNLFYLFEPFNCNSDGNVMENEDPGNACLMRFKDLDSLTTKLVNNLSKRVQENDKSELEFRMLTLAKPVFVTTPLPVKLSEAETEKILKETQSLELKRPSNFVDLPDGSQLVRATKKVADFGAEVEYIAPFMCAMSSAVGEKYALRTWSTDVLDFILTAGHQLYKKAKFKFEQLARLDIPKVSLGHTDYAIEVEYVFDAPMKVSVMKSALKKLLLNEREWAIIITEMYACAAFQRNGLFYLFDPFACNELGLDDGPNGHACLARFRNMHDLCIRIFFNKNKREVVEKVEYTRFILSRCKASRVYPDRDKTLARLEREIADEMMAQQKGEDDIEEYNGEEEGEDEIKKDKKPSDEEEGEPQNIIGYTSKGYYQVIEGTKSLASPGLNQVELMEDHFVCIAACLMVINKPIIAWDTKTVNRVFDIGNNVYVHADNLDVARKRTIRNILVGKHFFDIIITIIKIDDYKKSKNLEISLNYVTRKRKFCIVQLEEGTYVIYLDENNDGPVHLFQCYGANLKGPDDKEEAVKAGWIYFKNMRKMREYLKTKTGINKYTFYTFQVINVSKAPRSLIISQQIQEYIRLKAVKEEKLGKPFHERESWMCLHTNPWARISEETASGEARGKAETKWFNWDVEYANDLYSLTGSLHQSARLFKVQNRGKQTLANVVTAIGMTGIYDLREWNSSVVDNILRYGDAYFSECIKDIADKNYELSMDDLIEACSIYPFNFKIHYQPVVEGTMFLDHPRKFNLYKALRYFFEAFYYRAGVICAIRNKVRRIVAFAKRRENEYYMFDSQAFGPPMFWERKGSAYILRCTTLARLVHILVLTLRGGDFFIYEVIADNFKAIEDDGDK